MEQSLHVGGRLTKTTSLASLTLTILFLLFHQRAAGSEQWVPLAPFTDAYLRRVFFLDHRVGWIVGSSGTILKTTNGGTIWTSQDSHIDRDIIEVFFADSSNGWALASVFPDTGSLDYGTIILSTSDGGTTWGSTWHPDDIFLTLFFFDSQHGWMGGEFGRIVGTTDGGSTWFPANIDSSGVGSLAVRRIRFFSNTFGLATGGRVELVGVVWKTTNGGARWTPQLAGADPVLDFHYFDSLNVLGLSGGFDDGTSMIRTGDGGQNWQYEYIGIWGEPRAVSFRTEREAWVPLGFAGTMMRTTDSGQTWTESYSPDTTAMYDVVFLDSLTGFMVGGKGTILQYRGTTDVRTPMPMVAPASFSLRQNYPNPFNPSTTLQYSLVERSRITLRVYDVLGQEVRTLVDREEEPGVFEVVWDGRNERGIRAASGVYIGRIETVSRFTRTTRQVKMLLLE